MKKLWDISPPIAAESPLFPGDTAYSQQWTAQIGPGCPVNISAITMSPHIGAHADAPLHYGPGAPAIGEVDLTPYLGPCRVMHALGCGALITPDHLRAFVSADMPPRVLVRTCVKAPTAWSPEFCAFAPETITWLASLGVALVGIDSQSVDPADSKTLDSHQLLLKHNVRVLENLVLDLVAAGDYELIALPLKLTTADASPVRAVLREL
ncbi:MAG: arylformamidase [Burkholderiales bacterium]